MAWLPAILLLSALSTALAVVNNTAWVQVESRFASLDHRLRLLLSNAYVPFAIYTGRHLEAADADQCNGLKRLAMTQLSMHAAINRFALFMQPDRSDGTEGKDLRIMASALHSEVDDLFADTARLLRALEKDNSTKKTDKTAKLEWKTDL